VPEEEQAQLPPYVDSITIDMVSDGFRYVSCDGVPLLGLGPLELFEQLRPRFFEELQEHRPDHKGNRGPA
jgi:hypothetical protein